MEEPQLIPKGEGILKQIEDNPLSYSNLVTKIQDIFFPPLSDSMNITILTGIGGMIHFDWAMNGLTGVIPCRYWVHRNKRSKGYLVSLITKQGFLKIYIRHGLPYKFSVRYGGVEIGREDTFEALRKYIHTY